jgi:glycosyltransferase involved in cell wall biosynthesis
MYKELLEYVEIREIMEQVEFIGWIEHKQIINYLNKMHIAIHHSANPYMSPLKIFEYMASGLPVIGPNIPSVVEVFKDEKEILLVRQDAEDIASKMIRLIENNNFRKMIALNGKNLVHSKYGWANNVDQILIVLEKIYNENY